MKLKSVVSFILILSVMLAFCACTEAKSDVKINAKKLTISTGKSKALKLSGTKKKVAFKITTGKKYIKIKRTANNAVKITALKKGAAKIKATLGKKNFTCTVTVKAKKSVKTIKAIVNGKTFTFTLNSSKAAAELYNKLPLTLKMQELNGNEKYHYFNGTFSGTEKTYSTIDAGDLMIYGGNCLVLFYDEIKNSPYEYIKIGQITSSSGLKNAVGKGNVTINFSR